MRLRNLFRDEPAGFYFDVSPGAVFKDTKGTIPAQIGDPVAVVLPTVFEWRPAVWKRVLYRLGVMKRPKPLNPWDFAAVQPTASRRPVLHDAGGRLALEFDGIDDDFLEPRVPFIPAPPAPSSARAPRRDPAPDPSPTRATPSGETERPAPGSPPSR